MGALSGAGALAQDQTELTIRRLLDAGVYAEAEEAAAGRCAAVEAFSGRQSVEFARALDLFVEARVRNGKGGATETAALAEQALRTKEELLGRDELEVALSLQNLGDVRVERGESPAAITLQERALAIRLRLLSTDHPLIADSLDHLTVALMQLERFEQARTRISQAALIREANAANAPITLARTLELVAWLNRYTGDYTAALPPLDRAFELRRRYTPNHPDMVPVIEVRGDVFWLQGDIVSARKSWADALDLAERTLVPRHPAMVPLERRLALASHALGERAESRRLLDDALQRARQSLAPCHPELPTLLNDLARSLDYDGDYPQAYKVYGQARTSYEGCLGIDHSLTATVVHNQAILARKMGDLAEAEQLHRRAIQIWTRVLGANHPYVARGLDALAEVLAAKGDIAHARALYLRALAIRRAALGSEHPDVAWTLTNLARTNLPNGDRGKALSEVDQAIDIYHRGGVSDEPDHLAMALTLRARVERLNGHSEEARVSLEEALVTREGVFGPEHPLTAEALAGVAALDFELGFDARSLSGALEAERVGRDHLRTTIRYLPERQAVAYADKRPRGLDLAVSLAAASRSSDSGPIFDSAIRSRGVILDELAARAQSALTPDPALVALNAEALAARQRFANLMLRSLGEDGSVARSVIEDARVQKERAERALAEKSAEFRDEMARGDIGLNDVRAALPATDALVAFVRYDRTLPAASGAVTRRTTASATAQRLPIPSYAAFVIRAGVADVAVFPLGSAETIDSLVTTLRNETSATARAASAADTERTYRAAGAALRRRVWDPLSEQVKDASTVFLVPDGALNLVSFAALPVGQTAYLLDNGPAIHYLSAERDLVSSGRAGRTGTGLLAIGGADFDDVHAFSLPGGRTPPDESLALRSAQVERLGAECGSFQDLQFAKLAGTGREVREIASLWSGSSAEVLEARAASERAFKRAAPGHQVLHIATHGFFLGNCSPGAPGTRSVGGLTKKTVAGPRLGLGESPLLLSGLAFAGANRRAAARPSDEDGILTAEEVTALNLEGVEWAVLSACDTGLGTVKTGEGVFGLRRAFQVAGVHTVIMSLWAVEDQAARVWMRALYEARLKKHLNTAAAMREASLSLLKDRRARGQSTHPFFWGAFVAVGDWR